VWLIRSLRLGSVASIPNGSTVGDLGRGLAISMIVSSCSQFPSLGQTDTSAGQLLPQASHTTSAATVSPTRLQV
jgi:hypothetical protein